MNKTRDTSPTLSTEEALRQIQICCNSATPWTVACQASLSFTVSRSLLKLMSIESVMPSNHLILCHPLFLQPSIFPSIRVLSSELAFCIRCQSIGASASVQMKKWLLLSAFKPHFMCWPKFQKIFCFSVSNYVNDDFSSVQFSCLVVSDSLRPHELQHARPPCPSPTPRVHSNSRPVSPWCHPAISSLVVPFSSCPQSLPASKSFPMSQLFSWGGQNTGVSALASFLPKNTQNWSPLEWTG